MMFGVGSDFVMTGFYGCSIVDLVEIKKLAEEAFLFAVLTLLRIRGALVLRSVSAVIHWRSHWCCRCRIAATVEVSFSVN